MEPQRETVTSGEYWQEKYKDRLRINISGGDHYLFTENSNLLTREYTRVVIGQRGPYIEFEKPEDGILFVPESQQWRLNSKVCYYLELRTNDGSYVKVYYQKKVVDYADYKIGMYYVSPFNVYTVDGEKAIKEKLSPQLRLPL